MKRRRLLEVSWKLRGKKETELAVSLALSLTAKQLFCTVFLVYKSVGVKVRDQQQG